MLRDREVLFLAVWTCVVIVAVVLMIMGLYWVYG